jgi:hypothetical protein
MRAAHGWHCGYPECPEFGYPTPKIVVDFDVAVDPSEAILPP